MRLIAIRVKELLVLLLINACLLFHAFAWSGEVNGCIDPVYSLPAGSYLRILAEECVGDVGDASQCVNNKVEYDPERDILTSRQISTSWLYEILAYHFPVVLKDACHWVNQGFDIIMRRDKTPVNTWYNLENHLGYGSFLLKPPQPSYYPVLSGLGAMIYKDWRTYTLPKGTSELSRNCKKISWHLWDYGVSATCKSEDMDMRVHQVTLPNAFSCITAGLELVFVKDGLYCLNTWDNMGISIGKALNNEIPVVPYDQKYFLANLFRYSGLTDIQILAVMKAMNDYMDSVGRAGYIADIEDQPPHLNLIDGILMHYLISSLRRAISPVYQFDILTGRGVAGEIYRGGGSIILPAMFSTLFLTAYLLLIKSGYNILVYTLLNLP